MAQSQREFFFRKLCTPRVRLLEIWCRDYGDKVAIYEAIWIAATLRLFGSHEVETFLPVRVVGPGALEVFITDAGPWFRTVERPQSLKHFETLCKRPNSLWRSGFWKPEFGRPLVPEGQVDSR